MASGWSEMGQSRHSWNMVTSSQRTQVVPGNWRVGSTISASCTGQGQWETGKSKGSSAGRTYGREKQAKKNASCSAEHTTSVPHQGIRTRGTGRFVMCAALRFKHFQTESRVGLSQMVATPGGAIRSVYQSQARDQPLMPCLTE